MAQVPNSGQNINVLKISDQSQSRLLEYIRATAVIRDEGWQLRNRLEEVDRAYMRENDYTEEQRKAQRANRFGDPTKLQNIKVPMVMEAVEADVSFLTGVYLTDYPIFKFGADPEDEDIALQWNTLVGEDQVHYGWVGNLQIAFRNGSKYDFSPIEIDWKKEILYKVGNGSGANGTKIEENVYEGNSIRAIDPYNTIYDPRVPIHRCHIDGEFAGYIELMSRVRLKLFLASLGDARLKNDVKAFESGEWQVEYYFPHINPNVIFRNKQWIESEFNWTRWVTNEAQGHIQYKNMYTVVTLYARIMPYEFGISAPRDQTPDVWKLISVNGVLVYAQPIPNIHNYLPIIIAQPLVDNLDHQTKSPAENMQPFQEMTSALWNAVLASARRRISDRMIYNPLLIDPAHINSPNPAAKIPLRQTAYGRKMEDAIYKIPYEDAASQQFLQESDGISKWGMRANGQNLPTLGQFQKGNKLQDEWQQTMGNATARQRSQALSWEAFCFAGAKDILKSNYLQFAPDGSRYNRSEQRSVQVNVSELRQSEAQFAVGDGLLPIQRLMSSDQMQQSLQALAQIPGLSQKYDLAKTFSYIMKTNGADKLSQMELPPEEVQYQQELSQWLQGMIELTKAKAADTPENLDKLVKEYLGPKPQPPQPKQPAQGTTNGNATA